VSAAADAYYSIGAAATVALSTIAPEAEEETPDAEELTQQRVSQLKEGLSNTKVSKLSRTTSTAVNRVTRKVYQAESGEIAENIHPTLQIRMTSPSFEKWKVSNCAEFQAVNKALWDKAETIFCLAPISIPTNRVDK
jgi:hypothetical protein